ncbi:MAG: ANTAR domain-containing protein, partial [Clostridia bacterium]|nr:ANTAR domain-containing protein [Clostridia bacterium]
RLPLPLSSQALIGAVQMLSQFHQMRLPKRLGTEKETVEQAKRLLMKQHGITEPEAHRSMQQYAMNHGVKMADYAAQIIKLSKGID